jgi:hypothetical protein
MSQKLVDNLNKDLVHIMDRLFDRAKVLHHYKVTGNSFGCTVTICLTDHRMSAPRFILGKNPSKQYRDSARCVDDISAQSFEGGDARNAGGFTGADSSTPCMGNNSHKHREHINGTDKNTDSEDMFKHRKHINSAYENTYSEDTFNIDASACRRIQSPNKFSECPDIKNDFYTAVIKCKELKTL